MNTRHTSTPANHHYLNNSEDRKTLSKIMTVVYSPLVLMLVAAFFLA